MIRLVALALAAVALAGCGRGRTDGAQLRIVATTSLIASLVQSVAGDRAAVATLVPVGASPETFEPRSSDLTAIADARVIVMNGAGLEGWIDGVLRSARRSDAVVVRCTDGLAIRDGNPHLWLDPANARAYVARIRDALAGADPANAAAYRANAAHFDGELAALDGRIAAHIAAVPRERRGMIVFHNAWTYYNERYGIRTLGVIQEQPGREPSAAHLAALADVARAAHARTIFAEPQYDPKLVHMLAETAGVPAVAVLYDDSVGTSPDTRDYLTMLETDTSTIVAGLR